MQVAGLLQGRGAIMRQLFYFCDMEFRWFLCGVGGLALANGSGRQRILQSLHDIRLVKNPLSPGPLHRETPR